MDEAAERAAVEQCINGYFAGAAGTSDVLSDVFYSSCNLQSIDAQGRLELVPLDRFITFAQAKKLPPFSGEILSVDIVDSMARAHVAFRFDGFSFEDFLSLFKLNDRWRIVSKCYVRREAA
ncbi:MAG: nuclear transport factor 2 family protein [Myxococcota bacterium]